MRKLSGGNEFSNTLHEIQAEYQSFLGQAILSGTLRAERLNLLATQVFLQEKWPSHIAYVYLGMDSKALADQDLIHYVISIIESENLGLGSDGVSHTELAVRFADQLGISPSILQQSTPIPENRMLMDWCDMSALDRPWKEAFAVHIACESQFKLMSEITTGLYQRYGIKEEGLTFWEVHGGPVERGHSRVGIDLLQKHTDADEMEGVLYAFRTSCRLVCDFYNAIGRDA